MRASVAAALSSGHWTTLAKPLPIPSFSSLPCSPLLTSVSLMLPLWVLRVRFSDLSLSLSPRFSNTHARSIYIYDFLGTIDIYIIQMGFLFFSLSPSLLFAAPELMRSIQENHQKIASALLEKAKEICANHGIIPAEMVTEVGDPKEAICAAVENLNIQLLVLGSHSRGVIKRAFLGSVSNYCVHNAKCPVLVVRKPV
ncbi:hypothetical protein I3760_05G234800 [Carya illinoinensis]|nr:hypothetical protein I3760_05G234800 [Carya illinoinensis]